MTELNPSTGLGPENAQAESADARIDWPTPDYGHGSASGTAIDDAAVEAVLRRLGTLPELPVSAHGDVYASLHDGLADALNEDVAGEPAGDPRP